MRRKKTVVPAIPVEGVIDLEAEVPPTAPQTQCEAGIAELNADNPSKPEVSPKPKRKYTRRSKAAETSAAKPLADANRIYEKAVEVFRAFFNNEIDEERFLGRIGDLKTFQSLAAKLAE